MMNKENNDTRDREVTFMPTIEMLEYEREAYVEEMKEYLRELKKMHQEDAKEVSYENLLKCKPVNRNAKGNSDLLYRDLDCAVIERIHLYNREKGKRGFDSVRGVFLEGKPVYEQSGIMEKTHVQLCIINPNCIKGYFKALEPDKNWNMV